jgi:histidinol-phosphate aminotransferase
MMSSLLWQQANPHLRDLVNYEPGKPIEDLARELGVPPSQIIKLASNENPLGPSPKALEAMRDALLRANFYPDGGGYYLREAIAAKFGLQRQNVILGNGSNEIIEFLGHAFLKPGDEIVTSDHAFAVYRLMAQLFGAHTIEVPERPGFVQDLDAMAAAITPRTRQVYITSPNNPTGTVVSEEEIDAFMERVPDRVVVAFDEAYYEFLDNPPDTLKYVRAGRNVVVLRTFSKIQGMANLRIGYGMASAEMIDILQKTRQPFNANGIAQAGALAGLEDIEHQTRTKAVTDEGRAFLQETFASMGLEYIPSYGNFVLVNVGDGRACFETLLKQGIIVRAMNSYKLPEWIRVSVGTMDENRRFAAALRKIMPLG